MTEVSGVAEHHRHIVGVTCRDHLVVTHRTARLDDGTHTRLDGRLDSVGEGEEGVGGQNRPPRPLTGLVAGDAHRIHAAHLACANSVDRCPARQHDRVGLDVLRDLVGEDQSRNLLVAGSSLRDAPELLGSLGRHVALLEQEATDELLQLEVIMVPRRGPVLTAGEEANALAPLGLASEKLEGVIVE